MELYPIIAIDIGGTIEDTWSSKQSWFKSKGFDIGECPQSRLKIVNDIGKESLYLEMIEKVYSDENIINHKLVEGFLEDFTVKTANFSIVLLSSRCEQQRSITINWMKNRNIYNLIDKVVFLGDQGNKLEWCVTHGVKFFIDDDIRHFAPIDGSESVFKIHFHQCLREPSQTNSNLFFARNWKEVVKIIQNYST
jgi:uncharacterized HAD superfamily protein